MSFEFLVNKVSRGRLPLKCGVETFQRYPMPEFPTPPPNPAALFIPVIKSFRQHQLYASPFFSETNLKTNFLQFHHNETNFIGRENVRYCVTKTASCLMLRQLQIAAYFLFSNIRKGTLLYIQFTLSVGRSVGRLVGWLVDRRHH